MLRNYHVLPESTRWGHPILSLSLQQLLFDCFLPLLLVTGLLFIMGELLYETGGSDFSPQRWTQDPVYVIRVVPFLGHRDWFNSQVTHAEPLRSSPGPCWGNNEKEGLSFLWGCTL